MHRGLIIIAVLASFGCERDVRAVPLADDVPSVAAPMPSRALFDLLSVDIDAARTDRGSEVTFVWHDRSITLRELGDARTAGRRADYTAQITIGDEAPLFCRLSDDDGTPELVGDVVLCGRVFEVRCRGGYAPDVGVSGFWCLEELATLAIDPDSSRGAACEEERATLDVAQAPEPLRRTAEALSFARAVNGSELSTRRACDVTLGETLTLYASDGETQTVSVLESSRGGEGCDVRLRVEGAPLEQGRSLWLVGPAVATRARPAPPVPPLPSLGDIDGSWGRLRHEFDLDRDGATDTIVRSGEGTDHLLILDVDAARWYLRQPVVG